MPHPPWGEIWDALRLVLAPALGASALVMIVARSFTGVRFAPLASALAVAAGVIVGNSFREPISWRVDSDRPFSTKDFRLVLGWSLEGKPPAPDAEDASPPADEPTPISHAFYWLPWLAGLAILIDLLMRIRGIPGNIGWVARTLVAMLAGRLLTPATMRVEEPWMSWLLGLAIFFEWAVLYALSRQWQDGTIAMATALCFAAAGVVIVYAHSERLSLMALLFFASLAGIAAVSWRWPSDNGPALAAAALFLPGLVLNEQFATDSKVPLSAFLLVGLAPLACCPLLLPFVSRQTRWRRWIPGLALPLIAATFAVILAARAETLPFQN